MREKLHHYHLFPTMYLAQSGVTLLNLPHITAENFGTNGWISLLFCAIVVASNLYLIGLVYRHGQGQSIFDLLGPVPKLVMYPIYMFLIALWSLFACLVGKEFVFLVKMISFPATPSYVFHAIFIMLNFLFINKGIYNMVKIITLFFIMTLWIVCLFPFYIEEFTWVRMTPFIFQGDTDMLSGSVKVYAAYLGYEVFILLLPYIGAKTKWMLAAQLGNLYTTFVYVLLCIVSFGFYSFDQLRMKVYPVLDILSYIQLPFVERVENLTFNFFLLKVIVTTALYYWAAHETAVHILPRIPKPVLAFCIVALPYLLSIPINVLRDVEKWFRLLVKIEIGVSFILPLFVLLVLFIRRKERGAMHA